MRVLISLAMLYRSGYSVKNRYRRLAKDVRTSRPCKPCGPKKKVLFEQIISAPLGADDLPQGTSVKQEYDYAQVVHMEVQEEDFVLCSQSNEHHDNLLSVNGLLPSYIDVVDTLASTVVELEHESTFFWGPGKQGHGRAGPSCSHSVSRHGAQKASLSEEETDLDEDGVDSFFCTN